MGSTSTAEEYDLVVIGAGLFGLAMAKTYLQVNPSTRLLVLDSGKSLGGTWCAERIYDDLYTNNLVGTLEFGDFPMDFETFGVPPDAHVPGLVMHRYFTAYAQHFGVYERIKLRSTVTSAELLQGGEWHIKYDVAHGADGEGTEQHELIAKRMVLATGATSTPNIPNIKGSDEFGGHAFHFKDLSKHANDLSEADNVVVFGGSKSAVDAVYHNASKGRHVDWVIRDSGRGPAWLLHSYVSPLKLQFEKLATTRFMTFLSPCIYDDGYPMIRRLLHDTRIGRALLRFIFGKIDHGSVEETKYNDHPETKKLIPHGSVVWIGTNVGILNHPTDFFSLIHKDLVHVHISDITSLSKSSVHLSNNTTLPADALIYGTGWSHAPSFPILPASLAPKLAVGPAPPTDPTIAAADAEIMRRFPELKDQPPHGTSIDRERANEPAYRAYRHAIPPAFLSSRNLAYCGLAAIGLRGFWIAEMHALWITAFFADKLSVKLPGEEEAARQALLESRFFRYRASNGLGAKSADMVFEIVPFIDTLCRDLGIETKRKGGWREIFEYYGVHDYSGVVGEWMKKENLSGVGEL
ncbi:hypothetical protein V499_03453 [Pseudogymnoascus sp. VKM F-103]|uniref:Monooxygenase n=1 Tax=Pseudogymnoascus verrucosus TaxID=342668 RepID=A0A1B8GBA4_9PEZI|nr:monooxygenase [Pseudogymnoascus verrucosus]KFY77048.1 hypothetical protein V499_03453 [Pseudogymnoascus sp. VKM F-103]OBT93114.1 monooxygenase [Pseudogymnoascus verrucosus]